MVISFDEIFIRGLIFSAFGVVPVLWGRAKYGWLSRKAKTWEAISAQIQMIEVEQLPRNAGTQVTLRYSYFVNEYHSGEYVCVFGSDEDAYDFERFLRNLSVPAKFNPKKPDRSLLDQLALMDLVVEKKQKEKANETLASPALQFERAVYPEPPKRA